MSRARTLSKLFNTDGNLNLSPVASINSEQVGGRRNLIINGAMSVAQRGTSSSSTGYQTVDRFKSNSSGVSITRTQESLSSGDPYDSGFRNFFRAAVSTASSSTSAYAEFQQILEGRNIAQSGWDYPSTSSDVSLSFWARSSLAGTYYIMYRTGDGTEYRRNSAFTLVANTWKKVTFTTAGNSNLQIDNDTGSGLYVFIVPYYGTDFTGGEEVSTTDWYDRNGQADAYLPNFAQNWANTSGATFDLTGVQLEVGSTPTNFEHRSYAEELSLCQRYYFEINWDAGEEPLGAYYSSNRSVCTQSFHVQMRIDPTVTSTFGSGGLQSDYSNEHCFRWYGSAQQISVTSAKADAEL